MDRYLLSVVKLADEQVEQVEVAAVEEQVDEAKHGSGAHHCPRQIREPHNRLDDPYGDQVKAWQCGDHWVPLHNHRQKKMAKKKENRKEKHTHFRDILL